jgi:hypothetical protein
MVLSPASCKWCKYDRAPRSHLHAANSDTGASIDHASVVVPLAEHPKLRAMDNVDQVALEQVSGTLKSCR